MKLAKVNFDLLKQLAFLFLSGNSYMLCLCLPAASDVRYFQKFNSF